MKYWLAHHTHSLFTSYFPHRIIRF